MKCLVVFAALASGAFAYDDEECGCDPELQFGSADFETWGSPTSNYSFWLTATAHGDEQPNYDLCGWQDPNNVVLGAKITVSAEGTTDCDTHGFDYCYWIDGCDGKIKIEASFFDNDAGGRCVLDSAQPTLYAEVHGPDSSDLCYDAQDWTIGEVPTFQLCEDYEFKLDCDSVEDSELTVKLFLVYTDENGAQQSEDREFRLRAVCGPCDEEENIAVPFNFRHGHLFQHALAGVTSVFAR